MNNSPQTRNEHESSRLPLPSVEDHLNLSDWKFSPRFEQGEHGEYYWISFAHDVEFEKYIPPPEHPYRVLVTQFDGYGGAVPRYGGITGWRRLGECAISNVVTGPFPLVYYDEDTSLMVIGAELSDEELLGGLFFANVRTDPNNSDFWRLLDHLQPYIFIAYMENDFFATKNKEFIKALQSPSTLADIEEQAKSSMKKNRMSKWKSVGPECGPEKCIEQGCDRLRIELAVRCYMHQLIAFGAGY